MAFFNNIISAQALHAFAPHEVLIIDTRHSLMNLDFGRDSYLAAHIPNAHFLDMETDLSGVKTGANGRHPLPDLDTLAEKLRALGLNESMQVVAYDDAAGAMAGRVWWLLRALGHERVAVLDGGINAWTQAGFALVADLPQTKAGGFSRRPSLNRTVSADEVVRQLPNPLLTLVDARAPERYRGEVEPLDPIAGHIPTARNYFMMNNVDERGYFKSAEQLRAQWADVLDSTSVNTINTVNTVVNYCGSGVTACHNLLSMHIAGLDVSSTGAAIYAGSWSEWCANDTHPMFRPDNG